MPFPNSGTTVELPFLKMHHTETHSGPQTIIPFAFTLPTTLPLDPCTKHSPSTITNPQNQTHLQLPPSIDYDLDKFCPEMCSVLYHLHAEADTGPERLTATRLIRLCPLYAERPPRLWTGEVCGYDTTSLRVGLWATKIGRVSLRAGECRGVYLPLSGRQQQGGEEKQERPVKRPMRLDLWVECYDPRTRLPGECQVKVTLEAVTYFTALPMGELPSLQSVSDRQGQAFQAGMCSWKNKSVGLTWSPGWEGVDGTCGASIVVPVPVPGGEDVVMPTFYHCYVAREYFARVEVVVGNSRTLRVRVPVQIYNSVDR
ncbi:hypothetical protein BBP40_012191 [Aspergillus hancockii]|nr:hypothetical protein BBP40_012191 [Aspergillus hancockii]